MTELSLLDRVIVGVDTFLKTTSGSIGPRDRVSPASNLSTHEINEQRYSEPDSSEDKQYFQPELSHQEKMLSARLMRINHCGEVCAQALYNGQALTATSSRASAVMQHAANEEADHLAWCEQRIKELGSHVSYLNPIWYAASFSMGVMTGLLGDKINLGFVAATEDEVCRHLNEHIEKLPTADKKSRAVLTQMRTDEQQHAETAINHGGMTFPAPVKSMMRLVSGLMTKSTYWI